MNESLSDSGAHYRQANYVDAPRDSRSRPALPSGILDLVKDYNSNDYSRSTLEGEGDSPYKSEEIF